MIIYAQIALLTDVHDHVTFALVVLFVYILIVGFRIMAVFLPYHLLYLAVPSSSSLFSICVF